MLVVLLLVLSAIFGAADQYLGSLPGAASLGVADAVDDRRQPPVRSVGAASVPDRGDPARAETGDCSRARVHDVRPRRIRSDDVEPRRARGVDDEVDRRFRPELGPRDRRRPRHRPALRLARIPVANRARMARSSPRGRCVSASSRSRGSPPATDRRSGSVRCGCSKSPSGSPSRRTSRSRHDGTCTAAHESGRRGC